MTLCLKICLNIIGFRSSYLYIRGYSLWYWDFIMMLTLCFVHYKLKSTTRDRYSLMCLYKEWTLIFPLWWQNKDFKVLYQSVMYTWCPPRSHVTFEYKLVCIQLYLESLEWGIHGLCTPVIMISYDLRCKSVKCTYAYKATNPDWKQYASVIINISLLHHKY